MLDALAQNKLLTPHGKHDLVSFVKTAYVLIHHAASVAAEVEQYKMQGRPLCERVHITRRFWQAELKGGTEAGVEWRRILAEADNADYAAVKKGLAQLVRAN